jgi:predicted ATP-grasp superfamily ATP-dependent carboligase
MAATAMATLPATGIDTTTPAVVLKFDQNVMHHGGLGAIRSLGRLGIPVYGVHEGPWAPAAASRYLRGRWIWRPDADDVERTSAGLLALAERIGRPAVLIPTDDAGAIFLAEHGAALREAFRFPAPPAGLPRRVAGKFSMYGLCREAGMPCPAAVMPGSLAGARDFAAGAGYPVIAKLTAPWSTSGTGLRSTSIIHAAGELAGLWQACERAGAGLMLQEFIPAGTCGDWFFHGYCGADSACRPAFTGVKARSYPAHAGLTSFGHAVVNDQLRAQVTALLAQLSYRGIADLDLRRDARDGQYKLLDFNPRLGAQFRLFRDTAGLDVVLAAYLDLTGQEIPEGAPVNGRRFLVENYDPIGALGYWRNGELRLRPWLASLRQADELAWFARDDLRPFGLMCVRMGVRAITRRFARPDSSARGSGQPRYLAGHPGGPMPGRLPRVPAAVPWPVTQAIAPARPAPVPPTEG